MLIQRNKHKIRYRIGIFFDSVNISTLSFLDLYMSVENAPLISIKQTAQLTVLTKISVLNSLISHIKSGNKTSISIEELEKMTLEIGLNKDEATKKAIKYILDSGYHK